MPRPRVSIAHLIAQYLVDTGCVYLPPSLVWPVSWGYMDDAVPDNRVTTYSSGGDTDGSDFRTRETIIHPTCQVRLRSRDQDVAEAKGLEIEEALSAVKESSNVIVTVLGVVVRLKTARVYMPLMHIGREEKNLRHLYTINFRLTIGAP